MGRIAPGIVAASRTTLGVIRGFPPALWRAFSRGWAGCGQALGDLLFPWSCLVCAAEGEGWSGPFCPDCRTHLLADARAAGAGACPRCALPVGPHADLRGGCSLCRDKPLGFDRALALGPYEGTIRDLCLRLKHEPNAWLAPWLSGLLAEAQAVALGALPGDSWVVPVPLHWRRRLLRGYNQAEALAQGLAHRRGLEAHRVLRRVRATDRLAHLKATERMKAMRGAFVARHAPGLKRRTVLLVDDILTTGATAGAAARALKQAGARHVVLAVVGRTL
jgi:ComF family protein